VNAEPIAGGGHRLTRRELLTAGSVAAAGLALRPMRSIAAPPLRSLLAPLPRSLLAPLPRSLLAPLPRSLLAPPPTISAPTDELESFVLERMSAGKLPGVSACVVAGGQVAWARGFGLANIWRGQQVDRNTLFMLASISKTVICTAVMQAVEDGLFALDDDVDTVLPFSVRLPAHPSDPITVRHLLTHTSGILDRWVVWDDLYVDGDSPIALGQFLQDYLVQGGQYFRQANFSQRKPGEKYVYSNAGASLAAYLVEVASGVGFDRWCDDRIFEPLGMKRAGWHLADVPARDVAMPYRWKAADRRYEAFGQYGYPDYPDGALRTTARALGAHMGMVMGRGRWNGTRVLTKASVDELLHPQLPGIVGGQGLIWYRFALHGRTLWGHNGGDQGVATVAFFDPRKNVGVAVLANSDWRQVGGRWPLQQIMDRLFDEGPSLARDRSG
jgi:CubicO group peptidase (beta-lactamase class C family)